MNERIYVVLRVSDQGERADDALHSPNTQLASVERSAADKGQTIVGVGKEIDVSGKRALSRRPGLLAAVEAVEAKEADAIVVAYFDRLVRSLKVQLEVVERIERAGGEIYALDHGKLTNGNAMERLTGHMIGAICEFYGNQIGEKTTTARIVATSLGRAPFKTPLGYLRKDGKLIPDPELAPVVVKAFEMRAAGKSGNDIRLYLAEHGVKRSTAGARKMLASRVYLGEISHGTAINLTGHEAIVSEELFDRVQRRTNTGGRKAKSERLLARQGILRCGSCGARMNVEANQVKYTFYRCPSGTDCPHRVTVSADHAEEAVREYTIERLRGARGRASTAAQFAACAERLKTAQDKLSKYLALVDPDEPAAAQRIADLTADRDKAQAAADRVGVGAQQGVEMDASNWDNLSLTGRRRLVKLALARVLVAPASSGSGPRDRLSFEPFGE
jgi:DNA invertase Pin-like site-specific DNA recombinase